MHANGQQGRSYLGPKLVAWECQHCGVTQAQSILEATANGPTGVWIAGQMCEDVKRSILCVPKQCFTTPTFEALVLVLVVKLSQAGILLCEATLAGNVHHQKNLTLQVHACSGVILRMRHANCPHPYHPPHIQPVVLN